MGDKARLLTAALACLAFFHIAAAACVRDDPTIIDSLGSGGSGAIGGNSAGGGGGAECAVPGDCGSDSTCRSRTCESGSCAVEDAGAGTPCAEDGGEVCNGMGSCVPRSCIDGVIDGDETDVDCGGDECPDCANGSDCLEDDDCESNFCDGASEGAGGEGGSAGGSGGAPTPGECAPCGSDADCELYACDAGVCLSTCSSHGECALEAWCEVDSCVPDKALGDPCALGPECESGFCADGLCCDAACGGACEACNVAAAGACTTYAAGQLGDPSCSPFVCDGASGDCATTCSDDSECAEGNYCDPSGNCIPTLPNGDPCALDHECQSDHCVDGLCCNTACANACDACDLVGSEGVCSPRLDGDAGDPVCDPYLCNGAIVTCPSFCNVSADCTAGNYCGVGQCLPLKPNGDACTGAVECQSNICEDGVCCNAACGNQCEACNFGGSVGTCTLVPDGGAGSPSCTPYLCNGVGTACPNTCVTSADCSSGNFCDATFHCAGLKANGGTCSVGSECQSGNCVDGYCCNTACGASCDACNISGSLGTCTVRPAGSTGSPTCSPYLCNGAIASCPSTCSGDANCASTHYCAGSSCVLKQTNGSACTAANQCQSGFCIDGFCCNSACAAACNACNVAGSLGTCTLNADGSTGNPSCAPYLCDGAAANCPAGCAGHADCVSTHYCNAGSQCVTKKTNGSTCGGAAECQSGFCADGYCCNSACGASCDSCNQAGNLGSCTPLPDGAAGSPACSPYLCNGAAPSCPTSCVTHADCVGTHYCNGVNLCVPKQANGAVCNSGAECASGNCIDGYCCNSTCPAACDACNVAGAEGTCSLRPDGSQGSPSCSPYLCNGTVASCPATCGTTADCVSGYSCVGGMCQVSGPPPAWNCLPSKWNSGLANDCDCGCGAFDPDCVGPTVASCNTCNVAGSCASTACPSTIAPNQNHICCTFPLGDGGFEGGIPNPTWGETSTNFGTPLCTTGDCGTGSGTGPRGGSTYWTWIGGICPAVEDASIDQAITIPVGTATLRFWLELPVCAQAGNNDYLRVTVDGTIVYSTTNLDAACNTVGYQEKVIDVSAWADGGVHTIAFVGHTSGGGGAFCDLDDRITNFMIDDVSLTACPP